MLEYLSSVVRKIGINQLEGVLKYAPVKDKRYCSMHLFARVYCHDYVRPVVNIGVLSARLLGMFDCFEQLFYKHYHKFLSYSFVLKHLLEKLGYVAFHPFLKVSRSNKTLELYIQQVSDLPVDINL
jgi:hypothetical protein